MHGKGGHAWGRADIGEKRRTLVRRGGHAGPPLRWQWKPASEFPSWLYNPTILYCGARFGILRRGHERRGSVMAEVTFASRFQSDGSLTIPKQAAEDLGLHPGDEVEVRARSENGITTPENPRMLDVVLRDLLNSADRLESQPGPESNDPSERAFGEIIKGKHRRMGLDV